MRETSLQALESIKEHTPTLLQVIWVEIRDNTATCEEIETRLNIKHQTASARINDLIKKGLVHDSSFRRKTKSGRNAIVWVKK